MHVTFCVFSLTNSIGNLTERQEEVQELTGGYIPGWDRSKPGWPYYFTKEENKRKIKWQLYCRVTEGKGLDKWSSLTSFKSKREKEVKVEDALSHSMVRWAITQGGGSHFVQGTSNRRGGGGDTMFEDVGSELVSRKALLLNWVRCERSGNEEFSVCVWGVY